MMRRSAYLETWTMILALSALGFVAFNEALAVPYLTAGNILELQAKAAEPWRPLGILLLNLGEMAFLGLGILSFGRLAESGIIVTAPDGALIERPRYDGVTGARDLYNLILGWCTGNKRRRKPCPAK